MTRCGRHTLAASLVLGLLAPAPQAALPSAQPESLDEIQVEGMRRTLENMRQDMVQLEDEFFRRYNELNTKDDFDMQCAQEARTGTRFKRRYCRAVFEDRALAKEGMEHHRALPSYLDPTPQPWVPPDPAIVLIAKRQAEFRQTMLEVTRDNPELLVFLQKRAELAQQYEIKRRKMFGLRSVAAEPSDAEAVAAP